MAGRNKATKAAVNDGESKTATQVAQPDRDKLTPKQLARAILAKTLRPRVGEVRRLAEAVLQKDASKDGRKKNRGKKAKSGKLVKIPQKRKGS